MNYKEIVWLASYPKSGNTWLRCFLDAYFLGETDINELVCSVPDDTAFRYGVGDGSDSSKFPVDIQALTRPMAMLRMVRKYNEVKAGIPLLVKTHNAHMIANGIELLPESLTKSVIYLVRDPRDVLISFAKHMGTDIDTALEWFFDKYRNLCDDRSPKMADFVSSWEQNVKSYINADSHNVKTFRYEDIKANPAKEFSEILKHIGINPDQDRVKNAIELTKLDRLKQQEKEKGFRESSPYAKNNFFGEGKTGGWKGKLTPAQEHKLNKRLSGLMKRLGYLEARKIA